MHTDDDVEGQLRAELGRVVASARGRRRLSDRVQHGDDEATRRQLSELGLLDAMLAHEGAQLRHVLAGVEEVAVGLVAPELLFSTVALWTAASVPGCPPDVLDTIRSGATAVAWPGMLIGHSPVSRNEDGSVTGRLGYVPGGLTAERLLLVLPDDEGALVCLIPLHGAHREPLQVLDPSRPAVVLSLNGPPTVDIGRLSTVGIGRVRAGWLVALAADCLGGMRAAHEAALEYARQRTAFGRSIGSFQAVRHRCADMFVDVEATRAVLRGAIAAVDDDREDAPLLALAAASQAMDGFCRVADSAILVHGALGFTYECDAHFFARRAYSNAALLGGVDGLRAELARI